MGPGYGFGGHGVWYIKRICLGNRANASKTDYIGDNCPIVPYGSAAVSVGIPFSYTQQVLLHTFL